MIAVKWRKSKNLNPEAILEQYSKIASVNDDGSVSFPASEYHGVMATLQGMVEFPDIAKDLEMDFIVLNAARNMAKTSTLTAKAVMKEINAIVNDELATKEIKFHVLTSLSIDELFPIKKFVIEDCRFRLLGRHYPPKYNNRDAVIENNVYFTDTTPKNYTKIIISLKAKSIRAAASKALRVIDIKRSLWCLLNNNTMEYFSNYKPRPINKIRLGEFHTIHKENGKIASEMFWFEPNFIKADLFSPKKPKIFRKNFNWAMGQIFISPYGHIIKKALLRYVRALDEKDHNVGLIKLWGALEELASPSQANYDLITRRVSFLCEEREYHKQALENLREYRNRNVHSGEDEERAKNYCFQLQHYFYKLVIFHLGNAEEFSNLEEANSFLDLPNNKEILEKRKRTLEKAIKFISP